MRSFGFVGFIRVCAGGYLVDSGSMDSFRCVIGAFRVIRFVRVLTGGRLVHSGSLGSLGCALGVILGHWDR